MKILIWSKRINTIIITLFRCLAWSFCGSVDALKLSSAFKIKTGIMLYRSKNMYVYNEGKLRKLVYVKFWFDCRILCFIRKYLLSPLLQSLSITRAKLLYALCLIRKQQYSNNFGCSREFGFGFLHEMKQWLCGFI